MSIIDFHSDFASPDFGLDLSSSFNRATLESMKAGQSKKVLVADIGDRSAPSILAIAIRSENGDSLYVVVTTAAGKQRFAWTWEFLQGALNMYRQNLRAKLSE